ncbi:MAG: hypothetical protein MJA29_00880 [Candidatus Omnitrophica bacterium]|nr:hypothetical protein [Candidatus Omnitrophota bacterium]
MRKTAEYRHKVAKRKQLKNKALHRGTLAENGQAAEDASETMQFVEVTGKTATVQSVDCYDETMLERARTQWQFGDWESLSGLERDTLQQHPDRAKLALLAAAGHAQQGSMTEAKQCIRLAKEWGCKSELISRMLIAGVHNSLGRAEAAAGRQAKAFKHFEGAIATGTPGSALRLSVQARANHQLRLLGLSAQENMQSQLKTSAMLPFSIPYAVVREAKECLLADDAHEAIDAAMASKRNTPRELFLFCLALAEQFVERKDKLTAVHFLQTAQDHFGAVEETLQRMLVERFIAIGRVDEAADITVMKTLVRKDDFFLDDDDRKAIINAYKRRRNIEKAKAEHGHDVLIGYLRKHLQDIRASVGERQLVLIEIGSTRENFPGQGSTGKIADFCKENRLHFITVDMDPHNSRMAAELFNKIGTSFDAITMKGEDFLRDYTGNMDFVFLDAYDFDHGRHSDLRQSRYKKYLGHSIDDHVCHQMHLECVQSVVDKLSERGLVCIDDTWLDDGKWSAKGTLAMPYLLEHGFRLLEARNRAALLSRSIEK